MLVSQCEFQSGASSSMYSAIGGIDERVTRILSDMAILPIRFSRSAPGRAPRRMDA